MVTCIGACACANAKCQDECAAAASTECGTLITELTVCGKESPACSSVCAGDGGIYVTPRPVDAGHDSGKHDSGHDSSSPFDAAADACRGWGCGDAWAGWEINGAGMTGCTGLTWQHAPTSGTLTVATGCSTPVLSGGLELTCCPLVVVP